MWRHFSFFVAGFWWLKQPTLWYKLLMLNHVRNLFFFVSFFWVDIRIYIYMHMMLFTVINIKSLSFVSSQSPPLRCFDRPKPWCFPQKRPGVFASERDAKDKGDVRFFFWKLLDLEKKHLFLRKLKQKFLGQGSLAYSILKSTSLLPSLHIGLYWPLYWFPPKLVSAMPIYQGP